MADDRTINTVLYYY